jgi:hypothetical protein
LSLLSIKTDRWRLFNLFVCTEINVIELVTFLHKYHIITSHTLARKTPYETPAKTKG